MRLLASFAVLAALAGGVACPKRFDPSTTPEAPTSGNAAARARFEEARARFERDDWSSGQDFARLAREFPDDPIAPHAALYAGMAAHRRGAHAEAVAALAPLADDPHADEDVRRRARFFLGLSYVYTGEPKKALALLEPFVGQVAEGEELGELFGALAEAAAASGDLERALVYYDELFARGRPAERTYVATRVRALVDALPPEAAEQAWARVDKRRASAAFLGLKLALSARASGDAERAREILDDSAQARANVGLPEEAAPLGQADPQLVGALLPLSGPSRLVGEAALRGLAVAAGTWDRVPAAGVREGGAPAPFAVVVRDSARPGGGALAGVDELAGKGVIAVIGPVDAAKADEAAARAEALGVPLVTLDFADSQATAGAPHVFRIVLPVEDRARALARHAIAAGAKSFAVLAPEMSYGARATQAFTEEVTRLGGQVVAEAKYPKTATAFVEPVRKVAAHRFDALFVPDAAARLELIAPQLAVANLVVAAPGTPAPRRAHGAPEARTIALLSTAEALSPKFLRAAGRYAVGAVLAPGFYPDDADPRIAPYVTRFRAAFGDDPTYLDAYAYDAALVVRAAVEGGAMDRDAVATAIAEATVAGLTGDVRFGPGRRRVDPGVLYTVSPTASGTYAIRAIRSGR